MYRSTVRLTVSLFVLGSFVAAAGCNYDAPSAPDSSSTPGPEGAVISLAASGVSPSAVDIAPGQSVTFVNNDSVAHEIVSGPVPSYDQCPPINRVGRLEPGQSMQTGALMGTSACSFIDLLRTGDSRWQGTITVE
jgi:plastocyanin